MSSTEAFIGKKPSGAPQSATTSNSNSDYNSDSHDSNANQPEKRIQLSSQRSQDIPVDVSNVNQNPQPPSSAPVRRLAPRSRRDTNNRGRGRGSTYKSGNTVGMSIIDQPSRPAPTPPATPQCSDAIAVASAAAPSSSFSGSSLPVDSSDRRPLSPSSTKHPLSPRRPSIQSSLGDCNLPALGIRHSDDTPLVKMPPPKPPRMLPPKKGSAGVRRPLPQRPTGRNLDAAALRKGKVRVSIMCAANRAETHIREGAKQEVRLQASCDVLPSGGRQGGRKWQEASGWARPRAKTQGDGQPMLPQVDRNRSRDLIARGGGGSGGVGEIEAAAQALKRRTAIVNEIISTERSYVAGLRTIITDYLSVCQKNNDISASAIRQIFSNVELICNFNQELLKELDVRLKEWDPSSTKIGDIFLKLGPFLKMYTTYSNGYEAAMELHISLMEEYCAYSSTIDVCQAKTECELDLAALLIMPIQRIPRYRLLLQDLLKHTQPFHCDYETIKAAVEQIMHVADHVNEQVRQNEDSRSLLGLSKKARAGLSDLVLPHRKVIHCQTVKAQFRSLPASGPAVKEKAKWNREKLIEWELVIFNDMIAFCHERKEMNQKNRERHYWTLKLCWVEKRNDGKTEKDCEHVVDVLKKQIDSELGPDGSYTDDLREGEAALIASTYTGQWMRGLRHGTGRSESATGSVYQGNYEMDLRVGVGTCTYASGAIYEGPFFNDNPDGKGGELKLPNGDIIRGSFRQGSIEVGTIGFVNGDVFTGEFANGEMFKGSIQYRGGSMVYEGSFKDGMREGTGKLKVDGTALFDGCWKKDRPHGVGTLVDPKGASVYKGQFENGKKHGAGHCSYSNGSDYTGQWADNHPDGEGRFVWNDKSSYDGLWKGGKRHGQGKMVYADGSTYEGQWADDQYHGSGTQTMQNGLKYSGNFEHGRRQGRGSLFVPQLGRSIHGTVHGSRLLEEETGQSYDIGPNPVSYCYHEYRLF